jgi:Ca-activated chloride channel family protein
MNSFASRLLSIAFLALVSGLCPAAANAQKPNASPTPPAGSQDSQIEPIFTRRVRLPITVLDKKGLFVSGLTKADFQVLEDKVPQQIESFSDDVGEALPLYVAVLMDTSSSTLGKLTFERDSALDFIQLVVRARRDRALFATFDDSVKLRQDFTDKINLLESAVHAVKELGSKTALYDAIYQVCDEKMRSVQGRRVMVVITDGEDTYSRAELADAIDLAQRTETTIFAISTKAGFSGTVGGVEMGQIKDEKDNALTKLSEETGGTAFFTGDRIALERSLTKIAKELRTQYLLTYRSTNETYDGSYRRIDVKLAVANRNNLKIRTKRGYKAITDAVKP